MDADRSTAIATLLGQAEGAHAVYETDVLNGVYDEAWPRWYATYAVDHGLAGIVGHDVDAGTLATFLSDSYGDFSSADPKPAEAWSEYIAARIAAEL